MSYAQFKNEVMEVAPSVCEQAEAIEAVYAQADKSTLGKRAAALACRATGYSAAVAGALGGMPSLAFAQGGPSLDITNLESILSFIGKAIMVVGIALAAWNLVQVGMSMKDNQGFQMDKNVWGIVGGIAMVVAGGAFNTAASKWS